MKEEEAKEINIEHQKCVDPKENSKVRYSKNISSFDVRDENIMVDEKEDQDKECENTEEIVEEDYNKE